MGVLSLIAGGMMGTLAFLAAALFFGTTFVDAALIYFATAILTNITLYSAKFARSMMPPRPPGPPLSGVG